MSKVLPASCQAQVVTVEGFTVPAAEILSKGIGVSDGVLLVEGEDSFYLTSSAQDLETLLTKLTDALTKLTLILTAIGAGMTGPTTAPPPTLAADILAVNALVTQLTALKGALK